MFKLFGFLLASFLFLLGTAFAEDGKANKNGPKDSTRSVTSKEDAGPTNGFGFQYTDTSGPIPVRHYGELSIPISRLIETSRWTEQGPAISVSNAIQLAETEAKKCQFLPQKVDWMLTELLLNSYHKDRKLYWCWIATFHDPKDVDQFDRKATRIAVLMNGEVIAPTFRKIEITDPLFLGDRLIE